MYTEKEMTMAGIIGLLIGIIVVVIFSRAFIQDIKNGAIRAGVAEYALVSPSSKETKFQWKPPIVVTNTVYVLTNSTNVIQ